MSFVCVSTTEPTLQQVLDWINEANVESLPTHLKGTPKANCVYIFRLSELKDINVDGFKWHQSGKYNCKKTGITIIRFYVVLSREKGKRNTSSDFTKVKFMKSGASAGVLYYNGDPEQIDLKPHGNSKSNRVYHRTLPSTLDYLKTHVNSESIPKIYADSVRDISRSLPKESATDDQQIYHDKHVLPRNYKQIANIKRAINEQKHLHHDEIYSIYLLAKTVMREIIRYVTIYPDLIIVVALPAAVDLANRLLKDAEYHMNLRQLLTYDTTFNLCNLYVSFLVMRNTQIVGSPIFPVFMMLHSSRNVETHTFFWNICISSLKINAYVPLVVDREKSISQAIKKCGLERNLVYCKLHIVRDIRFWCSDRKLPTKNYGVYSNMIDRLALAETVEEFERMNEEFKYQMAEKFRMYYETSIEQDLKNYVCRFSIEKYPIFHNNLEPPSTNIAEAFNALVKNYQQKKETRSDMLILNMVELQTSILCEFNRSINDSGRFIIAQDFKESCKPLEIHHLLQYDSSAEIINLISESLDDIKSEDINSETTNNLAQIIIKNKLVGYEPHNNVFTVASPYSDDVHNVKKVGTNFKCTCARKKYCFHIKAVEYTSGIKIEPSSPIKFKLSQINTNLKEMKAGKKPKNNVKLLYEAADDSKISQLKKTEDKLDEKDIEIITYHEDSGTQFDEPLKSPTPTSASDATPEPVIIYRGKPIPEKFKIPEAKLRMMPCLLPPNWLIDDVMNEFALQLIHTCDLQNTLLLIPTWIWQCLVNRLIEKKELDLKANELQFLNKYSALNKDILLVIINTGVKVGSHWLLGVIIFKEKKIIIVDSYAADYDVIGSRLFNFVAISYALAGLNVDINEWEIIIATDRVKQNNDHDCGVITCLAIHSIAHKTNFIKLESLKARNYIKYVVSKAKCFKSPTKAPKIDKSILDYASLNSKNTSSIKISNAPVQDLLIQTMNQVTSPATCSAEVCFFKSSDDKIIDLCVICRNWFHRKCHSLPALQYFICNTCTLQVHKL